MLFHKASPKSAITCAAILILAILAIAMSFNPQAAESKDQHFDLCCKLIEGKTKLTTQIVMSGLEHPWSMAFLPDQSILVTERGGSMRLILNGSFSQPIAGLPGISPVGQGGLLDVALDPDFQNNNTIYFSFSQADKKDQNKYSTVIAKAVLDKEKLQLNNVKTIFVANNKSSGGRHFGSRIRFAPDGTLFATLGDRGQQDVAQDPFNHAGSVIRINSDGSIPNNNPFANGKKALAEIWSIGHRNAQGAAIHPQTGALWTLAHGARGGDEINQPQAGKNYGWPVVTYGIDYSGAKIGIGTSAEGFEQPVYYWDPSIAPSGLDFYDPETPLIPQWKGSLLAGALKSQMLVRLQLEGNKIIAEENYLIGKFGRIRDVRTGPDGAVWLLTDSENGQLIRLTAK